MRSEIEIPDELGAEALDAALEGLVELGVADLTRGMVSGHVPTLYTSGVRYERERGTERWLTPSQVHAARVGDCEDLAAWRAAECRVSGEDPDARARVIRSGPRTWHAIVEHGDGTLEDPSRVLGMGGDELGSLSDWDLTLRRDGRTWVATLSRGDAAVSGRSEYGHEALARACELGAEMGDLIPGLDTVARIAQGALSAALPSAQAAATAASMIPGATGDLDANARRIALQITRIATTEARRKLAAAQRQVSGASSSSSSGPTRSRWRIRQTARGA